MKKMVEKIYDTSSKGTEFQSLQLKKTTQTKKKKFQTIRAALVCLLIFTVLCGFIFPLSVTAFSQTAFPYEANGSQIIVTLPDGTKKIYGSELIGQNYEDAKHLFGRVNLGSPSNLSPESDEFKKLIEERIKERETKLSALGYQDQSAIPDELLTASGSGVDPHISLNTAYFQIPVIMKARNSSILNPEDYWTDEKIRAIIDQYTEGGFLGIFGSKRVNVLLVNLELDGLL